MRLLLLEPELAEAEDLVDHLLRKRRHRIDVLARPMLQPFHPGIVFRDGVLLKIGGQWPGREESNARCELEPTDATHAERHYFNRPSVLEMRFRTQESAPRITERCSNWGTSWSLQFATGSAVRCGASASPSPTGAICAVSTACRSRTTRGFPAKRC